MNGLKYENLQENIVKAIQLIPRDYYKNIVEDAYHRKDKYIPKNNRKNKTRKKDKKAIPIKVGVFITCEMCKGVKGVLPRTKRTSS